MFNYFILGFLFLHLPKISLTIDSLLELRQINPAETYTSLWSVINELPYSKCKVLLQSAENALDKKEQWILSMVDATAKPQIGILTGNIMHVGNYDQCLRIDETINSERIQGKYCSALIQSHPRYGKQFNAWLSDLIFNMTKFKAEDELLLQGRLSYGFCVPKTCKTEDLQNIFDALENKIQSPLHFTFNDVYCDTSEGMLFTTSAIVAIIIFSSIALIIFLSTLYDVFFCPNTATAINIWKSFSVVTNSKKLLSTSSAEENLNCLNGLRVISMMWIVLGHEVQYTAFVPHVNALELATEWRNKTENAILMATSVGVDTFFTIGGLLVVYLHMKSKDKGFKFSLLKFYLHRILRLTPSLSMVILFYLTLVNYMGSGPFWLTIDEVLYKPCQKNWWSTLIYLQNYVHPNEMCVSHAWYLAVDTQMYFLSPLIFIPLIKWPKRTTCFIFVFIVINCMYVFMITWKKHLHTAAIDLDGAQFNYIYVPTHVRGSVYVMGMICGYFLYKTRIKPLKLSKLTVALLWIFSLCILVAIVFGHGRFMRISEYNVLATSSFNALMRIGWSIAVSIIILLCLNGYGGVVNSFLSSKIFTVLIKLNYNIYLLHLPLIIFKQAQERMPTYYTNMNTLHSFWGSYVSSVGASVIWTLAFEYPVSTIEKLIVDRKKLKFEERENNRKWKENLETVQICED